MGNDPKLVYNREFSDRHDVMLMSFTPIHLSEKVTKSLLTYMKDYYNNLKYNTDKQLVSMLEDNNLKESWDFHTG